MLFLKIKEYLLLVGFNTHSFLVFVRSYIPFLLDVRRFKNLCKGNKEFRFRIKPSLADKYDKGGNMQGHYFFQDYYVAKRIYLNNPEKHLDIGSRIDGFVAHVAVYRKIEVIDIRPVESKIDNIIFKQADLLNLPDEFIDYCDSVSSLHVIEHIGLGRYGDKLDYDGHKKALDKIYLILKKGGRFYFSVPIGNQRIEFNSHRVFAIKTLLNLFKDKYEIERFTYYDDKGFFHEDAELREEDVNNNFGCNFGCGIFELIKNQNV